MKKIISLIDFVAAILLIAGPKYLFKVCDATEKKMKCYWSVQAEIGVALLLVVIGILLFFTAQSKEIIVTNVFAIAVSVVGILFPAKLIGGCAKSMMSCQKTTFPSIYFILGLLIVVHSIFTISTWRRDKE